MPLRFRALSFLAAFLFSTSAAYASSVPYTITVQGTETNGDFLEAVYTLNFDPTKNYNPGVTGLTTDIAITNDAPFLDSFNNVPPPQFIYLASTGYLEIAAANNLTFDPVNEGFDGGGGAGYDLYFNILEPQMPFGVYANSSSGQIAVFGATATITGPNGPVGGLSPIPEPSSIVLLGTGILGLGGVLRRRLV